MRINQMQNCDAPTTNIVAIEIFIPLVVDWRIRTIISNTDALNYYGTIFIYSNKNGKNLNFRTKRMLKIAKRLNTERKNVIA